MNRATFIKPLTLILLSVLSGIGCAKSSSSTSSSATTTTTPDTGVTPTTPTGDRGVNWNSGAVIDLTVDSKANFEDYVDHALSNPQNIAISVKLSETSSGSNKYAGTVKVSYSDEGKYNTSTFITYNTLVPNNTKDQVYTHGHGGKNHAEYNNWFSFNGKSVFHGFFQDQYGAILLVVDESINLGDGGVVTQVNGEVWYKNFMHNPLNPTNNPLNIPCWFLEAGPYECRTFLTDNETLTTSSALYPNQSVTYSTLGGRAVPGEPAMGWRKLGRFTGLDVNKAFGRNQ